MKKITIIYGELKTAVQKKAIEVLSELLIEYTYEYPACFLYGTEPELADTIKIYIGTAQNNPALQGVSEKKLTRSEEYAVAVRNGVVYIEGFDDAGVLYGCIDFYNKYILKLEYPDDSRVFAVPPFEKALPDFYYTSRPAVTNRGIWTWGHVIYDYRSFLDNMVKLKLNTVTIWNDYPPVNAKEMAEYAHSCGIKLFWGFSWCWDTNCARFSLDNLSDNAAEIAEKYEREYSHIGGDGIYFQSCTELSVDSINGKVIAEAVTELVNKTAALIFEKHPQLELQFGLHATSVKNQLQFIGQVDPRIRIVWENCGSFPFSYIPRDVKDYDNTTKFVRKIAVLRGTDDKFGVVTKGFTKLDWGAFEHLNGSVNIGKTSKSFQNNRVVRKNKAWRYFQAYWLSYADKAYDLVKLLSEIKQGDLYITPLVEDGMFEKNIMYPVALFSEMLWDTETELPAMMSEVALRDYVDFA
ncbi:MAG: hypothetical protein ACI3XQ_08050 [Eubacteriales bacterium]